MEWSWEFPCTPGTLNNHFLWMFGETSMFYVKIWNHRTGTIIKTWLFRVPGTRQNVKSLNVFLQRTGRRVLPSRCWIRGLTPKTNLASENTPFRTAKNTFSCSNHFFSGASLLLVSTRRFFFSWSIFQKLDFFHSQGQDRLVLQQSRHLAVMNSFVISRWKKRMGNMNWVKINVKSRWFQ